jgi:hypothetical protein
MNKAQVCGYMAQLMVRNHLNSVRTKLYQQLRQESKYGYLHTDIRFSNKYLEVYTPALDDQAASSNLHSIIDDLNLRLTEISQALPPEGNDPNSILATRLNAKILSAMAITFRPCLMMVLNREDLEVKISKDVSQYAKLCVIALEQSTIASNFIKDDHLITHA